MREGSSKIKYILVIETKELDATNCTAKLIDNSTEPSTETPVTISITQTQVQAAEGKYSFIISGFINESEKDKTVELSITLKDKAAKETIFIYHHLMYSRHRLWSRIVLSK